MNAKALKEYLAAAAACDPAASFAGPRELAAAAEEASPNGEWEIGVSAADASVLFLAQRRRGGIAATWNSKTARWLLPPKTRPAKPLAARKFSAALFEEPVASALADFHALSPVREVQFSPRRPGWTLILSAPPAWPMFLRCDVAGAFTPRAAQLSLLLRDARVVALDFDGDALWARVVGC